MARTTRDRRRRPPSAVAPSLPPPPVLLLPPLLLLVWIASSPSPSSSSSVPPTVRASPPSFVAAVVDARRPPPAAATATPSPRLGSSAPPSLGSGGASVGLVGSSGTGSHPRSSSVDGSDESHDFVVPPADGFYVRKGMFSDLREVADIFMDAFYEPNSIMYHYHRMLELDRIQNNFPYDDGWHDFYVACATTTSSTSSAPPDRSVIAFVDIDARPSRRRDSPPRPYLSDLAVRRDWRRRGVATHLVIECEEKAVSMGYDELYLRVERDNDAALTMYGNMGYERLEHPYFGVRDTTALLRGALRKRRHAAAAGPPAEGEGETEGETEGEAPSARAARSGGGGGGVSDSTSSVLDSVLDYAV